MTLSTDIRFIAVLDLNKSYVKMGRFLVYALIDPRTNEVRYVGRSCKGLRRARSSARESVGRKGNWTAELRKEGMTPLIGILEECDSQENVVAREIHWISEYRKSSRLTNLTAGGKDQTPFPKGKANPCHKKRNILKAVAAAKACYDPVKAAENGKRRWLDPEYRKIVTNANRTRTRSLKHRLSTSVRSSEYYRNHKHPSCKPVIAIDAAGTRKFYTSARDAAKALGGSAANICRVLSGKLTPGHGYRRTVAGHRFEFAVPALVGDPYAS